MKAILSDDLTSIHKPPEGCWFCERVDHIAAAPRDAPIFTTGHDYYGGIAVSNKASQLDMPYLLAFLSTSLWFALIRIDWGRKCEQRRGEQESTSSSPMATRVTPSGMVMYK